jgi:hypothetical protein
MILFLVCMLIGFCYGPLPDENQAGWALGYATGGFSRIPCERAIDAEVSVVALPGATIAGHDLALALGQAGHGCFGEWLYLPCCGSVGILNYSSFFADTYGSSHEAFLAGIASADFPRDEP